MSRPSRTELSVKVLEVLDPHLRRDLEEGRGPGEILKTLAVIVASILHLGGADDTAAFIVWIKQALTIHANLDDAEAKKHRLH